MKTIFTQVLCRVRFFSFLLIFLNSSFSLQAQTILKKGDIVIIGVSSTNTIDEFAWFPLVDLEAGTVIYFTDAGYNRSLNQWMGTTTTAGAQDGLYRFTAPAGGVPAGTVFGLNTSTSYVSPSPYLAITGTTFGNDTTPTFSSTGDQVSAFQSTDNPSSGLPFGTTNITLLFMATIATLDWASYTDTVLINTNSEKMSNLHPQLDHVDGVADCFIAAGLGTGPIDESDNAVYVGTTSGTRAELLAAISLLTNWRRYDPATPDGSAYVTAPTTTGWTKRGISLYSVTLPAAPSITAQPSNSAICAGSNTTFSVTASNTTSYQWQVNTGAGFTDITNGAPYNNATTATLSITAATSTLTANTYRCIATGTVSPTAQSNAATLTVSVPGLWLGTTNTNWGTTSNWSCGVLPNASTDVIINSGGISLS